MPAGPVAAAIAMRVQCGMQALARLPAATQCCTAAPRPPPINCRSFPAETAADGAAFKRAREDGSHGTLDLARLRTRRKSARRGPPDAPPDPPPEGSDRTAVRTRINTDCAAAAEQNAVVTVQAARAEGTCRQGAAPLAHRAAPIWAGNLEPCCSREP